MRRGGLLSLLLLAVPGSVAAFSGELPVLHQTPRALAMGGADVAVGGTPGALFSNPAGLARMAPGWQSEPLHLTGGFSRRTRGFVNAARDAFDEDTPAERRTALATVVRDYRGENLQLEASVVPSLGWRGDSWAFAGAWLASTQYRARPREGFGAQGLLSVDAAERFGPILGAAHHSGPWAVGVAVKTLHSNRLRESYSVRELVEITEAGDDLRDDAVRGRSASVDVGVQYALAPGYDWQPRLGVVVQDIGGLNFSADDRIPRTTSVGYSMRLPVTRRAELRVAAEYFDVLREAGDDRDHDKRIRLGAALELWAQRWYALTLRGGLYQGTGTAGIDLRLAGLRLGLTTYAEELGAYAGQSRDRRYLLTLGYSR